MHRQPLQHGSKAIEPVSNSDFASHTGPALEPVPSLSGLLGSSAHECLKIVQGGNPYPTKAALSLLEGVPLAKCTLMSAQRLLEEASEAGGTTVESVPGENFSFRYCVAVGLNNHLKSEPSHPELVALSTLVGRALKAECAQGRPETQSILWLRAAWGIPLEDLADLKWQEFAPLTKTLLLGYLRSFPPHYRPAEESPLVAMRNELHAQIEERQKGKPDSLQAAVLLGSEIRPTFAARFYHDNLAFGQQYHLAMAPGLTPAEYESACLKAIANGLAVVRTVGVAGLGAAMKFVNLHDFRFSSREAEDFLRLAAEPNRALAERCLLAHLAVTMYKLDEHDERGSRSNATDSNRMTIADQFVMSKNDPHAWFVMSSALWPPPNIPYFGDVDTLVQIMVDDRNRSKRMLAASLLGATNSIKKFDHAVATVSDLQLKEELKDAFSHALYALGPNELPLPIPLV